MDPTMPDTKTPTSRDKRSYTFRCPRTCETMTSIACLQCANEMPTPAPDGVEVGRADAGCRCDFCGTT